MSKKIKLKPCPFCGGKAELMSYTLFGRQVWFVTCGGMGCDVVPETADRYTPQKAAEVWNKRAGEDEK